MTRGDRNIAWIERYCRIPEGKFTGRPVKLSKHQKKWVKRIYDSPTRTFILSMGRKNAKTATSAFLLLLHVGGPEALQNTQLYSAAQSRDQASLLFDLAAKIVRLSPDLSAYLQIRDTKKEIECRELGTVYTALSADASTNLGKSPCFIVHDELGQVKGNRSLLYEALETACAAHDNPLSIIISTQAPTDNDLLSVLIDDGLTGADQRVKVELYTADKESDPFTDEAIREANPHFDEFMNQEEVRRSAQDAKRMPSREASYRNLILNQRVEAKDPFVTKTVWEQNKKLLTIPEGATIYGGLDLSSVSDLTACVWTGKVEEVWAVQSDFWLPENGLAEKSRADRVPYDVWQELGYLNTTPGAAIQYEFIASYLRDMFDRYNVEAIAFDRYNMRFLKPWLEREGFTEEELERFVEFGQGFVSMSPALRELESLLLSQKLAHGGHPVLTMCAMNAVVLKDPAENRKFTKGKASGRIDGMVALAMSVAVASQGEAQEEDIAGFLDNPIVLRM